ncbi:hypothetical protein Q8A67_015578 [Cirrhinus molitorella]|uniref:Uncharacterized protein n=1 Tax=Cirrhinus molitorella TaxID=172907 RepID=A0AA88PTT0_9TELE|nr:hypothetical protein Q8A67_015578 [Cirrhinus molitorella]
MEKISSDTMKRAREKERGRRLCWSDGDTDAEVLEWYVTVIKEHFGRLSTSLLNKVISTAPSICYRGSDGLGVAVQKGVAWERVQGSGVRVKRLQIVTVHNTGASVSSRRNDDLHQITVADHCWDGSVSADTRSLPPSSWALPRRRRLPWSLARRGQDASWGQQMER